MPDATLELILVEIRGLRQDLAARSQPANADASVQALVGAIAAGTQSLAFTAAELLDHARISGDARLQAAIIGACGIPNARRLGKALARAEGLDVNGAVISRAGTTREGITWRASLRV